MQQKSYFFEWLTATSLLLIVGFIGVVLYTGVWRVPMHKVKNAGSARYSLQVKLKADVLEVNETSARKILLQLANNTLQKRIESAGKLVKTEIDEEKGIIIYHVSNVTDTVGLKWLLSATGRLEFFHTFELKEIWSDIQVVNSEVAKYRYLQKMEDIKNGKGNLSKGDELFGPVSLEKAVNPEVPERGQKNDEYSLFTLLYPNLKYYDGKYDVGEGPVIGYANEKDTATINYYLQMPEVKKLLPGNIKFLWAINPLSYGTDNMALYAINCSGLTGQAPITGESLKSAVATYDKNGVPEVDLELNTGGSAIFERMTAEASSGTLKKCIAIVLDDKVYSAPRVQQVIKGGRMQITGVDNDNEATRLVSILSFGQLNLPVTMVSCNVSKNILGVF